jgi:hypothetical protein
MSQAARWVLSLTMLAFLCAVAALVVATIAVSLADIRDEQVTGGIFAASFLLAFVAGLMRLPLAERR